MLRLRIKWFFEELWAMSQPKKLTDKIAYLVGCVLVLLLWVNNFKFPHNVITVLIYIGTFIIVVDFTVKIYRILINRRKVRFGSWKMFGLSEAGVKVHYIALSIVFILELICFLGLLWSFFTR